MGAKRINIVASTCIGTFTSPWLEYAIASIYNIVDEVIVVNGGYDINNPSVNNKKLERESKAIKEIDINGKITEVLGDWKLVKYANPETETVAARNMSMGVQVAYYRNPDAILEIKCDQVFYPTAKRIPYLDLNQHSGYQFWEYTYFIGNLFQVFNEIKPRGCDDGARLFRPSETDYYNGQGQPIIRAEQFCVDFIQTGHLKLVYPDKYTKEEKLQFAYERAWGHLMCQNSIGEHAVNVKEGRKLTLEEIDKMARDAAKGVVNAKGIPLHLVNDPRSPKEPPPICLFKDPVKYIKRGYPL